MQGFLFFLLLIQAALCGCKQGDKKIFLDPVFWQIVTDLLKKPFGLCQLRKFYKHFHDFFSAALFSSTPCRKLTYSGQLCGFTHWWMFGKKERREKERKKIKEEEEKQEEVGRERGPPEKEGRKEGHTKTVEKNRTRWKIGVLTTVALPSFLSKLSPWGGEGREGGADAILWKVKCLSPLPRTTFSFEKKLTAFSVTQAPFYGTFTFNLECDRMSLLQLFFFFFFFLCNFWW